MNNIINNGQTYINVFNTGDLSVPVCANIPFENRDKVIELYAGAENFIIEYTDFKRVTNFKI